MNGEARMIYLLALAASLVVGHSIRRFAKAFHASATRQLDEYEHQAEWWG